MLQPNTRAPDFTLPGTTPDGDGLTTYRLRDALDDGPVLLNFYVFDFHPACTEHLCTLHDLAWFDLDDALTVYGVSTDRAFSHAAFADAERLTYPLLADSDSTVAADYDVRYDEYADHRHVAKRAVFLVDSDQTVTYAWSTDDPRDMPDWTAVRAAISDLAAVPDTVGDGTAGTDQP